MDKKALDWERIVSHSFTPISGYTAEILWVGDDGEPSWRQVPVLGLVSRITETYTRDSYGKDDDGQPLDPPSFSSLRSEGYRFSDRGETFSFVVLDLEFGPVAVDDSLYKRCYFPLVYRDGDTLARDFLRVESLEHFQSQRNRRFANQSPKKA